MEMASSIWRIGLEKIPELLEFLTSAKWCVQLQTEHAWTFCLGCISASCVKLSWQPSGWKLCWTCKQHVSSVSATRLPNVTQNAFFAFSSGFFPSKYGWCKWWTRRTIQQGYWHHGDKISRQLQPQHDGQLLLVSAVVKCRLSQPQKQVSKALLNSACALHKDSSELIIYTYVNVNKFL